jgi:hypothetical protein
MTQGDMVAVSGQKLPAGQSGDVVPLGQYWPGWLQAMGSKVPPDPSGQYVPAGQLQTKLDSTTEDSERAAALFCHV